MLTFRRSFLRGTFLVLVAFLIMVEAHAQVAPIVTTTTLAVSPSASVVSGTLVTLTATVADAKGPVLHGTVNFSDGTRILASVQLVSTNSAGFTPGTATLKTLSLAVGTHSITAKFNSTNVDAASASTTQTVTVSGPARTVTALSSSGTANGSYGLNAVVVGATPSGSVTITDTTTGTVLGTPTLSAVPANSLTTSPTAFPACAATNVADVNGDGIDDLLGTSEYCVADGGDGFAVYLGNGDGTFQAPKVTQISPNSSPGNGVTFSFGDFNGDGELDVIANGIVFLGHGDGTFSPSSQGANASAPNGIVADFDGDGILDIGNFYTGLDPYQDNAALTMSFNHGNGDGTFTSSSNPVVVTDGLSYESATLLSPQGTNSPAFVYSGTGGLAVGSAGNLNNISTVPPALVLVGDLNGDGLADIVELTGPGVGGQAQYLVFLANADGSYTALPPVSAGSVGTANILDFNHDGIPDMVNTVYGQNSICANYGDGTGALSSTQQCYALNAPLSGFVLPGNFEGFGPNDFFIQLGSTTAGAQSEIVTGPNFAAAAALTNVTVPGSAVQQIVASYPGDSTFAPSVSSPLSLDLRPPVTLQLVSSQGSTNEAILGTSVTFTLTPTGGGSVPTGTVQFYDSLTALGSPVELMNGVASYTTTSLTLNSHSITAVYSGDANHQPATSAILSFTVLTQGSLVGCLTYTGPSTVTQNTLVQVTGQFMPLFPGPTPTGSVYVSGTAYDGAPSQNLNGNSPITLNFNLNTVANNIFPPGGPLTLSFAYSGDTNYNRGSTLVEASCPSPSITVIGLVTLSLSSSTPGPIPSAKELDLSGQIKMQFPQSIQNLGNQVVPIGIVQLLDNGNAITGITLVPGLSPQSFSFRVNIPGDPLNAGTHSFTLSYLGSTYWQAATSAATNITVQATPTIALSANIDSGNSVFTGTTMKFVANVADIGRGPVPTGTVQFFDGSTAIGAPVPILQGAATLSSSQFAVGNHSVTAVYSGDSYYSVTTSGAFTFHVTSKITDTLIISPSTSSAPSGGSLVIYATVSFPAAYGAPAPTGTASLKIDGNVVATLPANGGNISFPVNTASSPLSQGAHIFSATYTGDSIYSASRSGNTTVTITGNLPKFTLTSNVGSFSNVVQGTPLTFTATVGAASGLPTPTGTVQFYVDTVIAGSPVTLTNGVATYTTSSLSAGTHAISAAYSGNSSYNSTTTNATAAIVTQGTDAIALSLSGPSTVGLGTPITLKGSLSVASLGPAPTGTVTLLDGAAAIGTAALSGSAPISLSFTVNTPSQPLTAGAHSFSLSYSGAAQWTGSTSSAQAVTVGKSETAASVASSGLVVSAGTSVTFTTVVSATVTSPVPTGTVQFYDGTTTLGTPVTLTAGKAIYTTSALTAGSHSISSTYSGDANFAASTSSAITEAVQDVTPQIGASTVTAAPGSSATETLTITSLGGLNETTSFECSGLPQGANCTFAPTSVTGSGTTTLTITTTGPTATLTPKDGWLAGGGVALACVVLLGWPKRRRNWMQMLGVLLLIVSLSATGCGGGGSSSGGGSSGGGGTPPVSNATPAGNYTITVTTTTGSGAAAIVRHLTFQLTVT